MNDLVLVSPPVGNFAQVHPALTQLTRYVRAAGFSVHQADLSIDCFHHFHSAGYVAKLRHEHRRRLDLLVDATELDLADGVELARSARLGALMDSTEARINRAKRALQMDETFDSPDRLVNAFSAIKNVGRVINALHPGQRFDFQRFTIDDAFSSFERLRSLLDDRTQNLLVDWLETVQLPSARLLGISVTYSAQFLPALSIAAAWRKNNPESDVVIGGSFVTRVARSFMDAPGWFDFFDYLVLDDGEHALVELLAHTERPSSLSRIPNLVYRHGAEVRRSPVRTLVRLDDLPSPMVDLEGLEFHRYLSPEPVVALPITRGCYWGKCTFCNISNQATGPYRVRSAERASQDVASLRRAHQVRLFDFSVDSFHPRGLEELAESICSSGTDVLWNAEVLLDPGFTRSRLEKMQLSGCRHLRFGLESVNETTLERMKKRNDRPVVERIVRDCSDLSICVSLMTIVGFPTEGRESALETLTFVAQVKEDVSFITIHGFNVSTGSPIAHDPQAFGVRLHERDGLIRPLYDYVNLNPDGMQPEEVKALVRDADVWMRQHYPQHGEVHTTGIGGWMTFIACTRNPPSFFKRAVDSSGATTESATSRVARFGHWIRLNFDVRSLEEAIRQSQSWRPLRKSSWLILSPDETKVCVLDAEWDAKLCALSFGDRTHVLDQALEPILRELVG